jgi:hypothetical protein
LLSIAQVAELQQVGMNFGHYRGGTVLSHFGTIALDSLSVRDLGPIPGDFNADGVVNAADYAVWRKGLGTTYAQSDFNVWRANFGQPAGSGAGTIASAAVPEPAIVPMLLMGMLAMCARRRAVAS